MGNRPVSHAAFYPYTLKTACSDLRVAAVGQVWTDPAFRGKGFATRVLQELEPVMRNEGVSHAILWTGEPDLYRKIGYVPAGRQFDFVRPPALEGPAACDIVGPESPKQFSAIKRADYLKRIQEAYDRHPLRSIRSEDDWKKYASIPNVHWYTHEDAYAVVGKGIDLENVVHEWGGSPKNCVALLVALFRNSLCETIYAPGDERDPVVSSLREICEPREGIVGFAKALSNPQPLKDFYMWGFDSI
jgi:hypothetical protein